ncbi:hypothetical protein O7606_00060 [Micromonospora sp. WMMD882]|uniref:hypothetical protein n=1 Tax=Micromonospora sp. WMMD882 TaxID=3015151 RepID=UPI00248B4D95|nr:hypothetical protein [Micromonospora sp. WMMD882]WBB79847.1 hypothetical protein O7606_00060 [Micromonospora sp. WMMD882]
MAQRISFPFLVVGALCALTLVGCTPAGDRATDTAVTADSVPATGPSRRPAPAPVVGTPPTGDGPTLLVVAATEGTRQVGEARVAVGDLWLTGRCAHGTLELHVEPLAVLPVRCDDLRGVPFTHQIVVDAPATYRIRVAAPPGLTWNLRVEQ